MHITAKVFESMTSCYQMKIAFLLQDCICNLRYASTSFCRWLCIVWNFFPIYKAVNVTRVKEVFCLHAKLLLKDDSLDYLSHTHFLSCHFIFFLQEYVLRASENLNAMVYGLFARLVPSENMVVASENLIVSLAKVSPEEINGISLEEGQTRFQLPRNLGDVGVGNLNTMVKSLLLLV